MEISARIKKCISGIAAGAEGIGENARLKEDAGLDSLSLTAVIVGLEEEFDILFDDGDLDPSKITTLKDLVDLVMRYV